MRKQKTNEIMTEGFRNTSLPVSVRLEEVLRAAQMAKGLPLTAFERLILQSIYVEQVSVSIDELFLKFKSMDIQISISTVQLCIKRFHEYGVLTRWKGDGERLSLYGPVI